MVKEIFVIMKYLLSIFVFLLPWHAVIITVLKCRLNIDVNILRFWKEWILLLMLGIVAYQQLKKHHFSLTAIYKNNYILWLVTCFTVCSFVYIFFPFFDPSIRQYLGFKYDVFFLFALLVWLYLARASEYFYFLLKTLFLSTGLMLIIFLPWFMSGDIAVTSEIIGFSSTPSTYEANGCISFAQNVTGGHHRFQGSFGDPIRLSVFLCVFYFLFLWYILSIHKKIAHKNIAILGIGTLAVLAGIFFAYTKTSMVGVVFWGMLFSYLSGKYIYKIVIPTIYLWIFAGVSSGGLLTFLYIKRHLFLHPEAILGRIENLIQSVHMFLWNPLWYGLGIAGPASQLATSSDKELAHNVTKFLPENWYVQILLEQWLWWIAFFIGLLCVIGVYLYRVVKRKKDFFSIGIFTAYITILLMANFTHIFEETATSFLLFLFIGAYLAREYFSKKHT